MRVLNIAVICLGIVSAGFMIKSAKPFGPGSGPVPQCPAKTCPNFR